MKLTLIAAAVAFALLPPSPAAAQQSQNPTADQKSAAAGGSATRPVQVNKGQTRPQKFQSLDKNGDGKISREAAQASPDLLVIFTPRDNNSERDITVEEVGAVPLVEPTGTPGK